MLSILKDCAKEHKLFGLNVGQPGFEPGTDGL